MRKLYYKILRDFTAAKILAALIASPERHKYIAKKLLGMRTGALLMFFKI